MNVQFSEINEESNQATGRIYGTPYIFNVELSKYKTTKTINNGTIVKLEIKDASPIGDGYCLSLFDDGWIIGPNTNGEAEILKAVLKRCDYLSSVLIQN